MRKIVLALVLVMCFASISFADGNPTAVNEYTININNDVQGSSKTTLIPITLIRPGVDKITAYEVIPYSNTGSSGQYIAVYDSATVAVSSELIGEKEGKMGEYCGERFVRPRKVLNGIWVHQGGNTTAIIYFVRE